MNAAMITMELTMLLTDNDNNGDADACGIETTRLTLPNSLTAQQPSRHNVVWIYLLLLHAIL